MSTNAIDKKGMESGGAMEHIQSNVAQPKTLPNLAGMVELMSSIDEITMPSEGVGEDHSGDWSGQGTGGATTGQQTGTGMSPRDLAIANLPAPRVMAKKLEAQILTEIKDLRRQVGSITRLRQAGGAYKLNELYARIRRLHSLLNELLVSSYDVLRRIFIKVFIDKQPIL